MSIILRLLFTWHCGSKPPNQNAVFAKCYHGRIFFPLLAIIFIPAITLFNNQQQFNNQFFLKPGQFTDDTSMALCLADSLIYSSSITQSIYLENESLENVMQEMKNASEKFDDKEAAIDNSKSDTENVALNCFDGRDLRCRFVCWWNQGYNNSFRFDDTRLTRQSIGLGGNIGTSL